MGTLPFCPSSAHLSSHFKEEPGQCYEGLSLFQTLPDGGCAHERDRCSLGPRVPLSPVEKTNITQGFVMSLEGREKCRECERGCRGTATLTAAPREVPWTWWVRKGWPRRGGERGEWCQGFWQRKQPGGRSGPAGGRHPGWDGGGGGGHEEGQG